MEDIRFASFSMIYLFYLFAFYFYYFYYLKFSLSFCSSSLLTYLKQVKQTSPITTFSGYPAALSSVDDYYVLNSYVHCLFLPCPSSLLLYPIFSSPPFFFRLSPCLVLICFFPLFYIYIYIYIYFIFLFYYRGLIVTETTNGVMNNSLYPFQLI